MSKEIYPPIFSHPSNSLPAFHGCSPIRSPKLPLNSTLQIHTNKASATISSTTDSEYDYGDLFNIKKEPEDPDLTRYA